MLAVSRSFHGMAAHSQWDMRDVHASDVSSLKSLKHGFGLNVEHDGVDGPSDRRNTLMLSLFQKHTLSLLLSHLLKSVTVLDLHLRDGEEHHGTVYLARKEKWGFIYRRV
jgi:hypothetical protein